MANLNIATALAAATALALAGCSKDEGAETASSTEGAETTTTTSVEEWRAEEELPEDERIEDPGVTAQPSMADPRMQTGAKSPMELSDGEIAKITDVVHEGEIQQAQLAQTKARSDEVKEFAGRMISEHSKARQKGQQLVRQQQLVTQDNAVATDLSNRGQETMQSLRNAQGAQFDRLYVSSQVEQHQKALDMIDKQLLAAADDAELKSQLEDVRDMIEGHLSKARDLQEELAEQQAEQR